LKWSKIAKKKWEFDAACIAGPRGNLTGLTVLFAEIMEPYIASAGLAPRRMKPRHVRALNAAIPPPT